MSLWPGLMARPLRALLDANIEFLLSGLFTGPWKAGASVSTTFGRSSKALYIFLIWAFGAVWSLDIDIVGFQKIPSVSFCLTGIVSLSLYNSVWFSSLEDCEVALFSGFDKLWTDLFPFDFSAVFYKTFFRDPGRIWFLSLSWLELKSSISACPAILRGWPLSK